MPKKTHLYLLPFYSNKNNLEENRHETEHESKISFSSGGILLELSEINSLIEDRYCLNMKSAKFIIEGMITKNEIKEAMIHHHPQGHPWKHIQFKLKSKNETIRINLEPVDEEDYIKCVKGFLYTTQEIIKHEQEESKIEINLVEYFFDDKITELKPFRTYLLNKIKIAYEQGKMLNNSGKQINTETLESLKSESKLLPFLNW